MNRLLLELKKLTLRIGGLTAVDQLDLRIEPGKIVALIGPNGAGKTSVFNTITGVYSATEGEVLWKGVRLGRSISTVLFVSVAVVSVMTGWGLVILLHAQSLWERMITANYVYQQAFPWSKAVQDGVAYLRNESPYLTIFPFFLGCMLGAAGTLIVWNRSRVTPDFIARQGIARTFQNIRLFRQMTALENVMIGLDSQLRTSFWEAAFRLPRFWSEQKQGREKAREMLRFVQLEKYADRRASTLCYGHQRKLEIARALASLPQLILLDEPAAGMNSSETEELMDLIVKIQKSGISILLIEHHMKVVMGISEHIVVLDYGNKIAEGTPENIRNNQQVIEAYLGKETVS